MRTAPAHGPHQVLHQVAGGRRRQQRLVAAGRELDLVLRGGQPFGELTQQRFGGHIDEFGCAHPGPRAAHPAFGIDLHLPCRLGESAPQPGRRRQEGGLPFVAGIAVQSVGAVESGGEVGGQRAEYPGAGGHDLRIPTLPHGLTGAQQRHGIARGRGRRGLGLAGRDQIGQRGRVGILGEHRTHPRLVPLPQNRYHRDAALDRLAVGGHGAARPTQRGLTAVLDQDDGVVGTAASRGLGQDIVGDLLCGNHCAVSSSRMRLIGCYRPLLWC
ncbi:Uncharacterised protein [Mycobacteroides abscessus]|nr:Uncharacterised protein [Mycobacteroides abscessus]